MMSAWKEFLERFSELPLFKSQRFINYQPFLISAAVLIVAITITVLVTIPQFIKLFQTFKTISDLRQQIVFFQNKRAELEAVNIGEYKQDLDTALVALPVDQDIPGVVSSLLVALSGSGMTLNDITFSKGEASGAKVAEYQIKLDISGQESDLRSFLERVKVAPRIVKLDSIEFSNDGQTINAVVGFLAFYQQLPTNLGALDKPLPKIDKNDVQLLSDIKAKVEALPKVSVDASSSAVGKLNPFSQ